MLVPTIEKGAKNCHTICVWPPSTANSWDPAWRPGPARILTTGPPHRLNEWGLGTGKLSARYS